MLEWTVSLVNISTHTLTWSVTAFKIVFERLIAISTHTLTWSVTKDFLRYAIGKIISTHTLTWSVTIAGVKLINALYDFNSHAHVERDVRCFTTYLLHCYFNSHAHVERDFDRDACMVCNANPFQLTRSRGA